MFDSVAAQNYPHLQHIVVDGGSTDGAREIIENRRSALAWSCSEPDTGMFAAINKGFAHSDGEIMGWLNSDDLLLPGALRAVGEIFANFPDVRWLSSLALSTWTVDGRCLGTAAIEGYSHQALLEGGYLPGGARHYGWIPQESTFWRRSLWEQAGGRVTEDLKAAGDFELWCRFYEHANLAGTPTPLGGFRVHDQQKSRDMDRYLAEARPVLDATRHRTSHQPSRLRRWLLRTGVASLPGLRGVLSRRGGYAATKIVADPEGGWKKVDYRFL